MVKYSQIAQQSYKLRTTVSNFRFNHVLEDEIIDLNWVMNELCYFSIKLQEKTFKGT